jgi:hypothetical protein
MTKLTLTIRIGTESVLAKLPMKQRTGMLERQLEGTGLDLLSISSFQTGDHEGGGSQVVRNRSPHGNKKHRDQFAFQDRLSHCRKIVLSVSPLCSKQEAQEHEFHSKRKETNELISWFILCSQSCIDVKYKRE